MDRLKRKFIQASGGMWKRLPDVGFQMLGHELRLPFSCTPLCGEIGMAVTIALASDGTKRYIATFPLNDAGKLEVKRVIDAINEKFRANMSGKVTDSPRCLKLPAH